MGSKTWRESYTARSEARWARLVDRKEARLPGITFTIAGIPIRVDAMFLLLALLLGPRTTGIEILAWVLIVFVGVLMHELGHATAYKVFGRQATILLTGGVGLTWGTPALRGWRAVLVSLAGPAVGIVVGSLLLVPLLLLPLAAMPRTILADAVFVNLGWGVLNLLPMRPLDGGNVVLHGLEEVWPRQANRASAIWSVVVGLVLIGLSIWAQYTWGTILLALFLFQNFRTLTATPAPAPAPARSGLEIGYGLVREGRVDEAIALAEKLLGAATDDATRSAALHLAAFAQLAAERPDEAATAIAQIPRGMPVDPFVHAAVLRATKRPRDAVAVLQPAVAAATGSRKTQLQGQLGAALVEAGRPEEALVLIGELDEDAVRMVESALFHAGRFEDAFAIASRRFEASKQQVDAYNAACCLARLGRPDEAVAWLGRAVDAGWDDVAQIDADADLASLRGRPDFLALRERLGAAGPWRAPGSA